METDPSFLTLTYARMRDLLESEDNAQVKGYISKDLAILRGSPFGMVSHMSAAPLRINEMRLLILDQGEAHPTINLQQQDLLAGDLVFVSGDSIVQMPEVGSEVKAKGMSCTNELLALAFEGRMPNILKRPRMLFVIHLTNNERQFIETLHTLLWQSVHDADMSAPVVLRLVATIITYIDHIYSLHEKQTIAAHSHEEQIYYRFIELVNQYAMREHKLGFYADKIFLSQRYLGTIIKRMSGQTAKAWIDKAIIMEAKVRLKHSDKSISQIAQDLSFSNFSFFNKYFRLHTGMTPLQYRQKG